MHIRKYGRLLYWVSSETREDLEHFVDLEPDLEVRGSQWQHWPACSCEAYHFGMRPCKHIIAALEHVAKKLTFDIVENPEKNIHKTPPRKYELQPTKTYAPPKTTHP